MAYQTIGRGASANDGTGDDLRTGAGKINANFVELYTLLGDGSALTSDTVVLRTAGQTLTTKSISLTDNTLTGTTAEFNTALSDDDFATLTNTVTLTNKTIDLTDNTLSGTTAEFNTALSDDNFATLAGTETVTNKTVNLANNTVTGTTAEFNTALSDDSFATLTNTVTLTNKTIDLTDNTVSGTTSDFNTALSDGDFATLAGTETLTNKTLTTPDLDSPTVDDIVFTGTTENTTLSAVDPSSSFTINLPAANATGRQIELTNDWVTINADGSTASASVNSNIKYFVDTSGGVMTLNLPAISGVTDGDTITIKDTGSAGTNNITIVTNASETIEGSATDVTVSTNYTLKRYVYSSDAGEWLDIS